MNFYASPEYLEVVAAVFFKGRPVAIEDVRVGDQVLRLLVVDKRQVITKLEFLDYHEGRQASESPATTRQHGYADSVVQKIIEAPAWEQVRSAGLEPAPFVDWSQFACFADYTRHLKQKSKSLLKEQERRRRRLVETLGDLEFRVDDRGEDVLALARQWKSQQLDDTGARNYLLNPKNLEFLQRLQEKSLLVSSTLRAGHRLLAVWLGFIHERVWSGWIFTYDHAPELRRYSLGHQLLHSMLEESYRRGHREFDFSIGDEAYKWFYATHARLLGPIGRPPLGQRVMSLSHMYAKRALSSSPTLLGTAGSLKRAARQQHLRLIAYLGQVTR